MKHSVRREVQRIVNCDITALRVCGNKPRKRRLSKAIRAIGKKEEYAANIIET